MLGSSEAVASGLNRRRNERVQELLADDLLRVAQQRGVLMPLYTLNNQVNKLVRIRRLAPYLSRRVVRFKGDSPGAQT